MAGRHFDEWKVGDRLTHEIRRTVTEADNLFFTVMTHNPQPLHLDIETAKASEFGQILVNGTYTFSLMVGLSVGDTTLGTLVANLGYDKLVMPKPVFIGDTLHAVARAGNTLQAIWLSGQFHGVIMPTTPIGSHTCKVGPSCRSKSNPSRISMAF